MNLAAILGICLVASLGGVARGSQSGASPVAAQAQQSQSSPSTANPSAAKPAVSQPRHRKKAAPSNCSSDAPAGSPASPCPPVKKVVRNGGSPEPTVQLTGGATAGQAAQQRSTGELSAATEENLKKTAGRP